VYSNALTGTIPESLRFRNLVFLDLGRNNFHGPLPDSFGQTAASLRNLHLDHNQFSGTIPASYITVGNGRLEALTLHHNALTGQVPGNRVLLNHMSKWRIIISFWLEMSVCASFCLLLVYLDLKLCSLFMIFSPVHTSQQSWFNKIGRGDMQPQCF
jgi:hypothetical protein